jgi:hypothetical protein
MPERVGRREQLQVPNLPTKIVTDISIANDWPSVGCAAFIDGTLWCWQEQSLGSHALKVTQIKGLPG